MSTKRFTVPDGTNSPEAPGWTIQETAKNPGSASATRVFPHPDHIETPANISGWTVQNSATGSDGKTVTGK